MVDATWVCNILSPDLKRNGIKRPSVPDGTLQNARLTTPLGQESFGLTFGRGIKSDYLSAWL